MAHLSYNKEKWDAMVKKKQTIDIPHTISSIKTGDRSSNKLLLTHLLIPKSFCLMSSKGKRHKTCIDSIGLEDEEEWNGLEVDEDDEFDEFDEDDEDENGEDEEGEFDEIEECDDEYDVEERQSVLDRVKRHQPLSDLEFKEIIENSVR